jgi:CRISPR-associated endonuclease/helicase Cas3
MPVPSKRHIHFWAKTTADDQAGAAYKPVAHHLLDVAACALRFLQLNPGRLAREARLTGLPPEQHALLCAFYAALHDLGKISRAFQKKAPALWPEEVLGEMFEREADGPLHWEATALLLYAYKVRGALSKIVPASAWEVDTIAAIAGHHGKAPEDEYLNAKDWCAESANGIKATCVGIAAELAGDIAALFPLELPAHWSPARESNFSFCLNGLITLADWVGSDSAYFEFEAPDMPLADYWQLALERADAALAAKGLIGIETVSKPALAALSPNAATPRPMQKQADELSLDENQRIVLMEDGTGSGKTEAALLLAARMMAAKLGEGIFVALPTMATANAMHARLETALAGLFQTEGARPATLVLAHGKAVLSNALDSLIAPDTDQNDHSVSNHFNAWIGDSRKKAFFADAGAGTIDQAFLSVLPKKHLTMRQYALAGRILIIDEAHACDAYMGEELKTLVEMHARLGGSVIILSATLGQKMRAGLVLAFATGSGLSESNGAHNTLAASMCSGAYPLLTHYSKAAGVEEIAVESQPDLARTVTLARTGSRQEAVALAIHAARQGACVAIICNAVDPAIDTLEMLREAGHDPAKLTLFHARFAFGDRIEIEKKVLGLFGRNATPDIRGGQILVATQVVEQSLDLDFDVMISDLAPVDLLVQRAGRLWRHKREHRPMDAPVLHVLSADHTDVRQPEWLKETLGNASYTYKLPGVMWRTARDLFSKGTLETPHDLRRLIEAAYQENSDDLPEILVNGHKTSAGEEYGKQFIGQRNVIKPGGGYSALNAVSNDEEIGTRLGEKTVTIRLAKQKGGVLVPFIHLQGAGDVTNWALSELAVRHGWLSGKGDNLPSPEHPAMVEALKATWPEWDQSIPVYEVLADGRLAIQGETGFMYDEVSGLRKTA